MRPLAVALVVACASTAYAQGAPSFDCNRASNAIERTICREPELAAADRAMASTYAGLAGRLSGTAKDHLVKDQGRWLAERNRDCSARPEDMVVCLKNRYAERTTNLKAYGEGVYPFISGQSIDRSGRLGQVRFWYRIEYPRFDGTTADFSAVNERFAATARKAADEATPKADSGIEREQGWSYERSFEVYRPDADAVTVAETFYGYSGGAHGYGATVCTLVDLRTGRSVGPDGVFAAGGGWLEKMVEVVRADLLKQFVEKPGFEDALEPRRLSKLLGESRHYCWKASRLELIFNAYEVGPYAAGPYEVEVSYDSLRPYLRRGGPIAR